MTAAPLPSATARPQGNSLLTVDPAMLRRRRSESRFRIYGIVAIAISLSVLAFM